MDELLFRQCREFVEAQGEGEWSEELIDKDTLNMVEFIERIRPARVKLNMDPTAEVIAALDNSAAREDEAREVARLAATLAIGTVVQTTDRMQSLVHKARSLLVEARKQVADAKP